MIDKAQKTKILMENFNKFMTESVPSDGGTAKLIKTIENGWNKEREMLVISNIYEVNPPVEGSNYLLVQALDSEYKNGVSQNNNNTNNNIDDEYGFGSDDDDDDEYGYWPTQQCWAWPCDKNGTIIKDKYGDEREISKSVDDFIEPNKWVEKYLKYKLIK